LREKDDSTWNLTGYASVYETPYSVGFYEETISRGAAKRTLGENPDVQLLINHEGLPLARTRSGTLRLEERERGLWVDADLDKLDPDAQRLQRKMARGDVDQMSFAFQVTDQDWNDDFTQRRIKSFSIHRGDVSVVNQGANDASVASVRSAEAIEGLRRCGPEAFVAALTEWRDHTLLTVEQRAGKSLSSATMEVLSQVLNLVAAADDAMDEAQPLLADLMGVPNPDADDVPDEPVTTEDVPARAAVLPDHTTRAAAGLALLLRGRMADDRDRRNGADAEPAQPDARVPAASDLDHSRHSYLLDGQRRTFNASRVRTSATRLRWRSSSSGATGERELRAAQEPGGARGRRGPREPVPHRRSGRLRSRRRSG
jgi:HK97 family phage prohead protease